MTTATKPATTRSHCVQCGRPTPLGVFICDEVCKQMYDEEEQAEKQPPDPDAGLWDEQFQLSGTMCAESTEKVDGLKLVTSTDGPEYGYAFVSPTLIDRLLVRLNSHAALVAALERLVAADNCNYDRDTMRSEGLFDAARLVLTQVQGEHRPSDGSEESR